MASCPDLAKALSQLLFIPYPTVDLAVRKLRAVRLLAGAGANKHTRPDMTARDAATLLLALLIDHERGGDYAAETARVMSLPLFETHSIPDQMANVLSTSTATNAGEAVEFLMRDMLETNCSANLTIDASGRDVAIFFKGPYHPDPIRTVMFIYRDEPELPKQNVQRSVLVDGRVLAELGKLIKLPAPA